MGEQDSVTLVALIISLFALVIASGQLLQQIFGTADGSRRCSSKIIGEWSRLTIWNWRWSEFRFEVEFYTPEIVVSPLRVTQNHIQTERGSVTLTKRLLQHNADDEERYYNLESKALPKGVNEAWQNPVLKKSETSRGGGHELMISWNNLLSVALEQQLIREDDEKALSYAPLERDKYSTFAEMQGISAASQKTEVGMYLKKRSWDFLPPEVVRPMASIRLGNVVVLASRLGMRWKELRPAEGVMRAEGNGLSITSTIVRGLGTALQFTSMESSNNPVQFMTVASEYADQMACGILPGCAELGLRRYPVIADNKKTNLGELLNDLKVSPEAQKIIEQPDMLSRCAVNDVMALFSPFIPLAGSPIGRATHPIPWNPDLFWQLNSSPFLFWEGRAVLLGHMRRTVSDQSSPTMKQMYAYMQKLSTVYREDFICDWERSRFNFNFSRDGSVESERVEQLRAASEMIYDLSQIHQATTTYFQELGQKPYLLYTRHKTSKPVFEYGDLVGAHVTMAARVADRLDQHNMRGADDQISLRGMTGINELAEMAYLYIDSIDDIARDMHRRGCRLLDGQIAEAWWVLVIRGIVWQMSLSLDRLDDTNIVPSSFYDSQMPIWIM